MGDAVERNYKDAAEIATYTDTSARNDLSEIRLTYDNDNVYILVSTAEEITKHEAGDLTWMNVLIGVEGERRAPRSRDSSSSSTVRPTARSRPWKRASAAIRSKRSGRRNARYRANICNCLFPKRFWAWGIRSRSRIKATDHVTHPEDIMDYYVSGDSAPIGRLGYTWKV